MNKQETTFSGDIQIEPRVLTQILGRNMIQSDSIVIAEQIKNSIDAKATEIIVDLSKISDDVITISDNGKGMSENEIIEKWLIVGTDNKTNLDSLLGGKGIGRFSLFRLAENIIVDTIKDDVKSTFILEKQRIETEGFRNISIVQSSVENEPSGTTITLNYLKSFIDLEEIEKGLENLNHPNIKKLFSIKYPNSYMESNYSLSNEILSIAPFKAEVKIQGTNIEYNYTCSVKGNHIYENRIISNKLIRELLDILTIRKANNVNLGTITFNLSNFYLSPAYLSWYGTTLNDVKNNFLDAYQGISVYRNRYKIFGHGITDWLKLAELRVERVSDNIDNKQTYGIITLDHTKSLHLEEDSSREGFIDSVEHTYFQNVIKIIVKQFGIDRKQSIPNMNKFIENSKSLGTGGTDTGGASTGGAGTAGAGTAGAGTGGTGSVRNIPMNKIGNFNSELLKTISSSKVVALIKEITTINITNYPLATAFLYRSLIEIVMDEFLLKNLSNIKEDFKHYCVDDNKNIKLKITGNNNQVSYKDISIGKKIITFKNHLSKTKAIDRRSLNHLDDLRRLVDDVNLAMHWNDKKIGINSLQTNWSNTIYFLEFLCERI